MRVIAGPEKKTRLLSEEERKVTAYHEMGHALGHYLDQDTDVHKISVVSRGQALGYTISLPREDRYLTRKSTLMDQLAARSAAARRRRSSSTRSRRARRTTSRR